MAEIAAGALTSLAFLWQLERQDGAGLALTSHDQPVTSGGVRHLPAPGMTPAAVSRSLGLEPDSSEVGGTISSAAISEEDLVQGRWNGAQVSLAAVDWTSPDGGRINLLGGTLGEVAVSDDAFSAELHGAAARLLRPVCPQTSSECRAEFGDKACRVDLAGRTTTANVIAANGGELRLDRAPGDAFRMGRLRFLRGRNCGFATTVIAVDGDTVRLRDIPHGAIQTPCRVELREGCDKRLETCATRFNNAVNFRGEPHLPGNDLLTRYPGA